jgi:hypothetical protein
MEISMHLSKAGVGESIPAFVVFAAAAVRAFTSNLKWGVTFFLRLKL